MWSSGKNRAFGDRTDPGYNASSTTYCVTSKVASLSLSFPAKMRIPGCNIEIKREWMGSFYPSTWLTC